MKYKLRGCSNKIQRIILVHISGKTIWDFFEQILKYSGHSGPYHNNGPREMIKYDQSWLF